MVITTTANDFEQLLHRVLTYAVLPKAILLLTSYLLLLTFYRPPEGDPTSYLLLITSYPSTIIYYLLSITYYLLPITDYLLPITCQLLPMTYDQLPITYYP